MMNLVSSLIGCSKLFGVKNIDHIDCFSGDLFLLDVGISHRGLDICMSQYFLDLIEI